MNLNRVIPWRPSWTYLVASHLHIRYDAHAMANSN